MAIREIVGIPEKTVKTRMFHARKRPSALLSAAASIGKGTHFALSTPNAADFAMQTARLDLIRFHHGQGPKLKAEKMV
jgi:hypothetical protein